MGSPSKTMCIYVVIMSALIFGYIDGTKFLKNNNESFIHNDYHGEDYVDIVDTNKYCDPIKHNCAQYFNSKYMRIKGKCRGGENCCTKSNPCGAREGDCDDDHDCKGNLKCGKNNCDRKKYPTFSKKADCCYNPAKQCVPACTGGASCFSVNRKMTCVCKKGFVSVAGQCTSGKQLVNGGDSGSGSGGPKVFKGTTKLQPLHVYMSSSSGNENNCIDGSRDTDCSTRYSNDPYPWMALEFERSVINKVKISNTRGTGYERTRNLEVWVYDAKPTTANYKFKLGVMLGNYVGPAASGIVITIGGGDNQRIEGTFVIIQTAPPNYNQRYINLAEVYVYGDR